MPAAEGRDAADQDGRPESEGARSGGQPANLPHSTVAALCVIVISAAHSKQSISRM
jgi:hypothetical protein